MVERTATVQVVNPHGMHLRPADLFVRTAMRFQAKVCVTFEGQQVDGRSIVELLMLAARKGTQLTICTSGDDCEEALAALVQLVERGFDEMEEKGNEEMTNDQ
jgi:phosphocarrier protein HPr